MRTTLLYINSFRTSERAPRGGPRRHSGRIAAHKSPLSLSLSLSFWIHEFSINVEILPLLGPLLESSDDDKEKAPGRPGEFAIESRK